MFRTAHVDKLKSLSIIRKQIEGNLTCQIPGCTELLTHMKGPGEDTLCREHQLKQREYGGMGRIDRPHSFHRKWHCVECGYNALEDPRLSDVEDEVIKHRIARILMHGDHQQRQADGGDDTAENVRSLCYVCHAKKTVINEDYRKT